ncbi:MAG: hypothetical protein A2287_00830 [Candidatus Melainabacteria bacterium RIFOXYA12_FULL_32_12]|nr:MAG: hypothetical protein A2255_03705 [Candidatus Melainabacteria bacterium RIFOXYA2_FULL_32_9]OGI24755.1 MAG: hypothetical protein A2287_00830 [Candidatus Melainabacteria bacterium RIFOXYA12_FULL_32_12]
MNSNNSMANLIDQAEKFALGGITNQEAIDINTHIIELNKFESAAYTRLAKCYLANNNISGAIEMYKQVLEFDAKNKIAINSLKKLNSYN